MAEDLVANKLWSHSNNGVKKTTTKGIMVPERRRRVVCLFTLILR